MISLRFRNMDLVACHHRSGQFDAPQDIATLPEVLDVHLPREANRGEEGADADGQSDGSGKLPSDAGWDAPNTTAMDADLESKVRAAANEKGSYPRRETRCAPHCHVIVAMDT